MGGGYLGRRRSGNWEAKEWVFPGEASFTWGMAGVGQVGKKVLSQGSQVYQSGQMAALSRWGWGGPGC